MIAWIPFLISLLVVAVLFIAACYQGVFREKKDLVDLAGDGLMAVIYLFFSLLAVLAGSTVSLLIAHFWR